MPNLTFNVAGSCIPGRHYMLDPLRGIERDVVKSAEEGKMLYFRKRKKENLDTNGTFDGGDKPFYLKTRPNIIFPLKVKPLNDLGSKIYHDKYWKGAAGAKDNWATYRFSRSGGTRWHAGRDLYGEALTTEIVAICDGVVLARHSFYDETDVVTILHTTDDGRKFIARYGEVDPKTIKVERKQNVEQGQAIAYIGKLVGKKTKRPPVINGEETCMLHFEYFTDAEKDDLIKNPLRDDNANKFQRRNDVADPLEILTEGYENTFN